jgi:DNA-binding transcriptional MerR regulator
MPEKLLTAQQLARTVKEPVSTVSFWAQEKLLTYQRKNGRTRLFPATENLSRIKYIRERQSRPEGCRLDEIKDELAQNQHHQGRVRRS